MVMRSALSAPVLLDADFANIRKNLIQERKRDETSSSQTQTVQTPRILHLEHAQVPEREETLCRRTSGKERKEEKTFHLRSHDAGKAETQSPLRFD